jgi:hypothetical protein
MLIPIIGFWVFIIFHECVHRWGKHSPLNSIKQTNVKIDGIVFFLIGSNFPMILGKVVPNGTTQG